VNARRLAVTAALLAAMGIAWWAVRGSPEARGNGASAPRPGVLRHEEPLSPLASIKPFEWFATIPASAKQVVTTARMVEDFKAAKDWRAFAINARDRPAEGGYFYAMYVSNICSIGAVSRPDLARNAIANTVARTGTLDAATAEATGRLTTLCGSFSGDEASSLYRDVRQASADSRDPVVNARRNVLAAMNANDSASLRDAARDLFMLRDPLAPFTGELLGMLISKAAGPKASAMWFDGQSFEIEDRMQSSILRLAVDISSCAENVPCDLDTRMVMGCLGNQFCTDKRVDYWKHET
jgi:hypothetical protein